MVTVPAAALLLKLTLDPDTATVDWGDLERQNALFQPSTLLALTLASEFLPTRQSIEPF